MLFQYNVDRQSGPYGDKPNVSNAYVGSSSLRLALGSDRVWKYGRDILHLSLVQRSDLFLD